MMNNGILHTFKSRRNRVWRDGERVYKQILPEPKADGADKNEHFLRASFEADMLKKLYKRGVYVPRLICCKNDMLAMEYIEGMTLTEYIEANETETAYMPDEMTMSDVVDALIGWFSSFYAALPDGVSRGDVNCRNFLLTPDGHIAGVDFERKYIGARETDLGRILAFILTYEPAYTPFKRAFADLLCEKFAEYFALDLNSVMSEKDKELKAMRIRRSNINWCGNFC